MKRTAKQQAVVTEIYGLLGFFGLPEPEWFSEQDRIYAEWLALDTHLIFDINRNGLVETYVNTLDNEYSNTLSVYDSIKVFAKDFHELKAKLEAQKPEVEK